MDRRAFLGTLTRCGALSLAGWPSHTQPTASSSALGLRLTDVTASAGIAFRHRNGSYGGKLLPETLGSGCAFLDYDADGWQDILLIGGCEWPSRRRPGAAAGDRSSSIRLYRNNRNGTFTDVTRAAGLDIELYGMGIAVGDFNNDGRVDVLVSNNGDAPLLLKNTNDSAHHWLGLSLQGTTCNRDATGARITWSFAGQQRRRLKTSGGSYLSSHDPREVLGIGPAQKIDWVEIAWPQPSGRVERITNLPIDRYVRIVEGKGLASA